MFNVKKSVGYTIIAVVFVSIVTIVIAISAYFNNYNGDVNKYYKVYNQSLLKHQQMQKEKAIKDQVGYKKENAQQWMKKRLVDFDIKYQESKLQIKEDLQESMSRALRNIKRVKKTKNKRKSIQDVKYILSKLNKKLNTTDLFLVNYRGDTLYGLNSQEDINARTIVLEEVQKVRRRGTGYIVSTIDTLGSKRHILVQDLGMHELFIGVNFYEKGNNIELKNSILQSMKNVMLDSDECLMIYEKERKIYNSQSCALDVQNNHYLKMKYKEFEWELLYGFDTSRITQQETKKFEDFQALIQDKTF